MAADAYYADPNAHDEGDSPPSRRCSRADRRNTLTSDIESAGRIQGYVHRQAITSSRQPRHSQAPSPSNRQRRRSAPGEERRRHRSGQNEARDETRSSVGEDGIPEDEV